MDSEAFAIFVFLLLTLAVGLGALLFSELLGPKRRDPEKNSAYECGMPILDHAHHPFHVKFYLTAILFILFDIETVFLLPYAVLCQGMGLFGMFEMACFIFVLAIGLVYCWKRGALEWD